MTDAEALDDYVDPPAAVEPADLMTAAKLEAAQPKPTLREMIDAINEVRGEAEDVQLRLVTCGAIAAPHMPYMRRAAILAAAVNFLSLIDAKKDAVKRALGGRG